jgi:hypothetical protein
MTFALFLIFAHFKTFCAVSDFCEFRSLMKNTFARYISAIPALNYRAVINVNY